MCVNKNCKILNKNFCQMLRLQGVVIQKMQGWGISNLQLWLKWTTYHSKQIEALQQLHNMSSCIADMILSTTPLAISFCLHILPLLAVISKPCDTYIRSTITSYILLCWNSGIMYFINTEDSKKIIFPGVVLFRFGIGLK